MSHVSFQIFVFLAELLLSLNWSLLADMLLVSVNDAFGNKKNMKQSTEPWKSIGVLCYFSLQYVVVPTRRSTAEALQISVCHLLGDAGSPYLIGAVRTSSNYPHSTCF